MKKIYDLSKKVTSLAERIEYEFAAHNPGISRTPVPISELKKKTMSLAELIAELTEMLHED